ncbi:serine dehydrogenasease [Klebsiella aerogenes]|uniref:SDH family Clp fold serine proteinase n=1 Tax=Klebsiella/Raoultella group TaxID=2890311 RepID=UPI000735C233|nr:MULTISPECIES: serine dehydrogenasease [Klebsiella/Raoultella group]KTH39316.1 serine dehydrogenasease [Klebsiella aerogenes]MCF6705928.1 serine dehydrogenasease [Raoultella ornithinolytica]PVF73957.1 serine dehydrogenase ase family protein [Klebsiella aerogenes]QDR55687.1 serine dehydrogenasease [Klebsiella aerogenes]TSI59006.1 serine dehydrogenasease [Klebsiella aerogenes]
MDNLETTLEGYIKYKLSEFREQFFQECDIITYYGGITDWAKFIYQPVIEDIGTSALQREHRFLVILLQTNGGSVESVEKMVEITRHFYHEVYFIVPDSAMSAGTIWCMSGDKIYMDYASSLGPIDPQVQSSDGKWVPALGYLDKVEEIIEKSASGSITQAELMMVNNLDLAELRRYEEARELSKDLLKKWLVEYKFRDWQVHETSVSKLGQPVTQDEKIERAREIATVLSDNKKWHSHSRTIGINTIVYDLRLKIEDYTEQHDMRLAINELHKLLNEFRYKTNREIVAISSVPF